MNLFKHGVQIRIENPEDFLKIKETLTRIGIASKRDNTLYQSCHILHKRGSYAVLHFKEMFLLDGKESTLEQSDIGRRNTIISLLVQWKLITVVEPDEIVTPRASISSIKIVSFKDKPDWTLVAKYTVGRKKQTQD